MFKRAVLLISSTATAPPTLSLSLSLPHLRHLHAHISRPPPPSPTAFVPNHTTFLTLIGRSLSRYASKIQSWDELFNLSSSQLIDRGIEPARDRRYLLRWREKFRRGEFGIGGDMRIVGDEGVGVLRVCDVPSRGSEGLGVEKRRVARLVVNVPEGGDERDAARVLGGEVGGLEKVKGVKVINGHVIQGPFVELVKGANGSVARLKWREGLWEHRRGHKVDGGERRKAEVRFKRGVEERKMAKR